MAPACRIVARRTGSGRHGLISGEVTACRKAAGSLRRPKRHSGLPRIGSGWLRWGSAYRRLGSGFLGLLSLCEQGLILGEILCDHHPTPRRGVALYWLILACGWVIHAAHVGHALYREGLVEPHCRRLGPPREGKSHRHEQAQASSSGPHQHYCLGTTCSCFAQVRRTHSSSCRSGSSVFIPPCRFGGEASAASTRYRGKRCQRLQETFWGAPGAAGDAVVECPGLWRVPEQAF